jgi:hypothetical protein
MIHDPTFSETFRPNPINVSRAYRVRAAFMGYGLLTSVGAFFVVGGEVLLDQLAIGTASPLFMLGTELLVAGACIGLFAIIVAIGLAVSAAFEENAKSEQACSKFGSHCNPQVSHSNAGELSADMPISEPIIIPIEIVPQRAGRIKRRGRKSGNSLGTHREIRT